MKYFQKIAQGIDMAPLALQLQIRPGLWGAHKVRQEFSGSPHKETEDIWVRMPRAQGDLFEMYEELECVPYRAWDELISVRILVHDLLRRVEGTRLGRVLITKLSPGGKISPHVDEGPVPAYYQRYQIPIQNNPGSLFQIGDEVLRMNPGEVWWINPRVLHSVVNNSDDDRISLIVDIRGDGC